MKGDCGDIEGERDRYAVHQHGKRIGEQTISFSRRPGEFVVRCRLEMTYQAYGEGGITYRHTSEEVWRHAQIHAFSSDTTASGVRMSVRARREQDGLFVKSDYLRTPLRTSPEPDALYAAIDEAMSDLL